VKTVVMVKAKDPAPGPSALPRHGVREHTVVMTIRRVVVAALLGALPVVAIACSSSPSTSSATTTAPATTSTTSLESTTWTAVWPTAASSTRYQTPEAAAQGFATDYLHMVNPVISPFQQGDARSGEVPVQPIASGPVTTVLVRKLGPNNSWWVLGAGTAAINLTEPVWDASVSSPVTLKGTSMAFEGTVQTQVREDDTNKPLGEGFVTGGSTGMGPFDGTLAFTKPSARYGAIVLYITSAENGTVTEAMVIRVRLG
jgi:hypothetical protein